MPRSKNPEAYPPQYFQVLERASAEPPFLFEVATEKDAYRAKMQLYALINAVDREEKDQNLPTELRRALRWRQLVIRTRGTTVVIESKLDDPLIGALDAALGRAQEVPSVPLQPSPATAPLPTSPESPEDEDEAFRNFFNKE